MKHLQFPLAVAMLLGLGACATVSPDSDRSAVQTLAASKTAGDAPQIGGPDTQANADAVAKLLQGPLSAEAAVRIALLNNPGLQGSMATLGISDAQRVQAGSLPNPHFSIGRFVEGDKVEIERALSFNIVGLITWPWRAKWQGQQHELAKLAAAQDVVRLAADTRKAWVNAVAAQQTVSYMADAKLAAEAGGELARRMARVGNWSKLNQAREQVFLADATAQLARAQQASVAAREQLIRRMGLWGAQTQFTLPERLPDLPKAALEMDNVEARALRERLDVRAATEESRYVANSLGLVKASGFINALDATYQRNTTFDNATGDKETLRGWELELPLPIFDWGGAANARAQGVYMQSVARVRETAVQARSEAREAYHGWRTAYDLALHYRDEVVPLRKFIGDETLLRYNGMLLSVFDLLGDMRSQIMAVNSAIEAQRDFWLAETDLQTVLSGTSPGALAGLKTNTGADSGGAKGH